MVDLDLAGAMELEQQAWQDREAKVKAVAAARLELMYADEALTKAEAAFKKHFDLCKLMIELQEYHNEQQST
jgi:hypothetical protein